MSDQVLAEVVDDLGWTVRCYAGDGDAKLFVITRPMVNSSVAFELEVDDASDECRRQAVAFGGLAATYKFKMRR